MAKQQEHLIKANCKLKRKNPKIFLLLFIGIFLISFASAADFDNIKKYNQDTKEATIINNFGMGAELATFKLVSNTESCGSSILCEAVIFYRLATPRDDVFSAVSLQDVKTKEQSTATSADIAISKPIDKPVGNINNIRMEISPDGREWFKYNPTTNFRDSGYIKLSAYKEPFAVLDWVANLYGFDINEWAIWGATILYDDFNNNNFNRSLWQNDTTYFSFGSPTSSLLEQNQRLELTSGGSYSGCGGGFGETYTRATAINYSASYLKVNVTSLSNTVTSNPSDSTHYVIARNRIVTTSGDVIADNRGVNAGSDTTTLPVVYNDLSAGVWEMNRTGILSFSIYHNGIFLRNISLSSPIQKIVFETSVAGHSEGVCFSSYTAQGTLFIDDVYLKAQVIGVNLNTPNDNFVIGSGNISFNATVFVSNLTLQNASLYIWNASGSLSSVTTNALSGVVDVDTTFSTGINKLGSYKWNVRSCTTCTGYHGYLLLVQK